MAADEILGSIEVRRDDRSTPAPTEIVNPRRRASTPSDSPTRRPITASPERSPNSNAFAPLPRGARLKGKRNTEMIVVGDHNRTGPHEVDTETADLKALRAASRALGGLFDLYYLMWSTGSDTGGQAERAARELEAVEACDRGAQGRVPQHRAPHRRIPQHRRLGGFAPRALVVEGAVFIEKTKERRSERQ